MTLYLTRTYSDPMLNGTFTVSLTPPKTDGGAVAWSRAWSPAWSREGTDICRAAAAKMVGGAQYLPKFGEHVEFKLEAQW